MDINFTGKTSDEDIQPEDRLTVDHITGLRNEHLFRLRLGDEFYRARDKELNGALFIIKLDRIIEINEKHGRPGGDEALRAIANIMRQVQAETRDENQMVFKLSGPFFGYFIRTCTAETALSIAQKLVKSVSVSELFIEKTTVSVGLVNLYEFFLRHEELGEITELIEKTAMFRVTVAERNGGNTICNTSEIADLKSMNRQTVLIIDPEQAAIAPLKRVLETEDFMVEICRDGETAFALINADPPGAIICEAMTPQMNGFMLRDRLLRNVLLRNIPYLLVSHKKNEDFIRKAIALDIRFFFRKPVSPIEIAGLLKNMLREKEK